MNFPASYDVTAKIVTALVLAAALGAAVVSHSLIIGFLLFLSICLAYAYSPRGYLCEGRSIVIKRLAGDVTIPLDSLRETRAAVKDDFRGCVRLWGVGGLFGYYGLFRTYKLGQCSWYMTNRKKAIVVVTDAKTILVSPDDAEMFLSTVGVFAPAAGSAPGQSDAPLSVSPRPTVGIIVGSVLGAAALLFALFAVLYSPGPPNYVLERKSLAIRDLFYPFTVGAEDVDVERIRVVDFSAHSDWRPVSRTNGFSNSHYHSGWFRVANGQKVRMYRASGTRLVLLPPRGNNAAVLIEVDAPDEFVHQIRRLWSQP